MSDVVAAGHRLTGIALRTPLEATTSRAADALEAELRAVGTPERAAAEQRYLKSELEFVGATVPAVRQVTRAFLGSHPDLGHDELVALADALWAKPIHERRAAAVDLLERRVRLLGPADMPLIERLLRESRTWALVDGLAVNVAGALLISDPSVASALDRWARDDDFWLRRSSLLAHLRRLRAGGELGDFARYADAMLGEREFFIRKAIGWVLREAGKRRPDEVVAWLEPRVGRASGVTMREAVKYLPPADVERLRRAAD
jgi:3-methyladenine DNA glycosylase AlkD